MRFILRVNPTAQQRPRFFNLRKHAHAYKSKTQVANELRLEQLLMEHVPAVPLSGPLRVEILAVLAMPKSGSRKTHEAMERGWLLPVKKPDVDNLAKQILDALTRLHFWEDDAQVVELYCRKAYGKEGCWGVTIVETLSCLADVFELIGGEG